MKHISVRVVVVLSAALLAVAGCSSSSSSKPSSSPTPKVKVAASPSPAGISDLNWALDWQVFGLDTPPPRNFETLNKEPLPAKAQNLTNTSSVPVANQVSDADVAKWLAAAQRSANIENYLVAHLDDQGLRGSLLAANSQPYGGDVQLTTTAKQAGATAIAATVPFTDQAVGFAFVPEALRTDTGLLQQFPLSEYVLVLRQAGPARIDQVFADGHKVAVYQAPASYLGTYLMAGTYKVDPVLGPMWYAQSFINCQAYPALQSVCSLLGP